MTALLSLTWKDSASFFPPSFLPLLVILLLKPIYSLVFLLSCLQLKVQIVRALSVRGYRTPGCDGFPMEFYLRFWSVLSTDLVVVLNSAFVSELKSCSQRLGIITFSFKMATVLTSLTGGQSAC